MTFDFQKEMFPNVSGAAIKQRLHQGHQVSVVVVWLMVYTEGDVCQSSLYLLYCRDSEEVCGAYRRLLDVAVVYCRLMKMV